MKKFVPAFMAKSCDSTLLSSMSIYAVLSSVMCMINTVLTYVIVLYNVLWHFPLLMKTESLTGLPDNCYVVVWVMTRAYAQWCFQPGTSVTWPFWWSVWPLEYLTLLLGDASGMDTFHNTDDITHPHKGELRGFPFAVLGGYMVFFGARIFFLNSAIG